MNSRLRGEIFDALKRALKARGWTYADLAVGLGLSEPTIKRLFADGDCKLGRLLEICDLLDVTMADLADRAKRSSDARLELSEATEAELADNPWLFDLFLLLQSGEAAEHIAEYFHIPAHRLHQDMRKLHNLGLAVLRDDGRFSVLTDQPLHLQQHGPLHARIREINLRFVGAIYDTQAADGQLFRTISRRMLPDTARVLQQEVADLAERIDKLARQDRLISPAQALTSWKFTAAFGLMNFSMLLGHEEGSETHRPAERSGQVEATQY
ncbi:MAG: helix-turn-helix domain-containing protein [Granulosicoccus sp.]